MLWLFVRLFGDGELAVRLPSILASTALIPVLFATGRAMFDRRTGLVAAALGHVRSAVIWYGQEARMYSLFMLLAALAIWAQVRVLRDGRPRNWVSTQGSRSPCSTRTTSRSSRSRSSSSSSRSRPGSAPEPGRPVKSLLTGCWLAWLALLVAVAPLAPSRTSSSSTTRPPAPASAPPPAAAAPTFAEGGISLYDVLSNFVWAIWGYHPDSTMLRVAALWPLLMLLSLSLLGQQPLGLDAGAAGARASARSWSLLLVGLEKRDLFEVRYFAGAVPVLLLLLARAVAGGARRRTPPRWPRPAPCA